jgi:GntR family transcriptional regulator
MRQVAVALKIDLNTVQRAYAELERDGVLTKLRGVGTFVTETPPPPRNARKQAEAFAARIAAQAKGQGIDLDDLAAALVKLAGRAS